MTQSEAEKFECLHWKRSLDPPYYVNSTAISADGKFVVAGTFFHQYSPGSASPQQPTGQPDEFGTFLFDRDGKQLWADKFVGYEGVYAVAISGDGSVAASGGWFSSSPFQGYVRAYAIADGPASIIDYRLGTRVNALALSADGSTLVAAADNVYVFQKSNGVFPKTPAILPLNAVENAVSGSTPNSAQAIAITSDGRWIVIGDYVGNVYLVENNAGQLGKPYIWNTSPLTTVHTVALTPDGQWFAVAGSGGILYLFSISSMTGSTPSYTGTYTLDTGGRVGWAAISDDGGFLSAIGNKGEAGAIVALQNNDGTMSRKWEMETLRNPNSTSMDASANYISVADGYPDGTPGHFSLYEGATGKLLWRYNTLNMNWPMFVSADGSGIVAGTDGGNVFYFTPK